jgi:acido-empty-quinoprotein group A
MRTNMHLCNLAVCLSFTCSLGGQILDPALLLKPPTDAWPSYHGDYSGRRYSTLDQINQSNVGQLTLAWIYRANAATDGSNFGGEHKDGDPLFWGGPSNGVQIKATPLMVNGVLYFAAPDHAWAIDARTGRERWHYFWKTKGGIHIGNRGFGMYGNWLFFETPDCYVVSLDAATGKERWHKEIADVKQQYFCTPAPIVVKNHVIVGQGGDSLDVQGWIESHDPETGDLQWKWFTTPQKAGDPGFDSWPDEYSRKHGGGQTWQPPTYDPELNLLYVSTGNPNPVGAAQSRKGDNLYTCSVVALDADTGKMKWYFQTSPHDTHDWDSTEVPVLVDGTFEGKPRKMLMQATRNGYFFVLDRATGQSLKTTMLVEKEYVNWSKGINAKGQPIPDAAKDPRVDGALVGPGSATNWQPPSFSPQTGLFYVGTSAGLSLSYLTDTDERPEGYGFTGGSGSGSGRTALRAIDYKTGQARWIHDMQIGSQGLMSTAGHLLFGSDGTGNFIAFSTETGKILWHAGLQANPSNGPETFLLDGRQYIVVGAGDSLYAFTLNR